MKIMKGVFALLIVGLFILGGCAQNGTTPEKQDIATKQTGQSQQMPQEPDPLEVGSIESSVDDTELDGLDAELDDLDW